MWHSYGTVEILLRIQHHLLDVAQPLNLNNMKSSGWRWQWVWKWVWQWVWQWVARGNIQQIGCIPQTEQHLLFGLILLCLGNVPYVQS